ncbi:pilus assembly PilX family protein [sulfur-oxidizing endosymbiont of Gigantopelta aegis]|uniref:pilus assembly PilX family protein n=1 Tax=sulfur-oxidizing endosymbiont of Gigantopelta aegis TaxID=2794934 RepID=UPI0018DD0801|nr:PilX N-terminal domain-containing pilus assembly protein [sulfur-oxidizing endosymbiont of Gigantopelta aegis]
MRTINVKTANQRGVALFVSLIFLLILTLLGISGMQTTILEEKMAGNFNDSNRAFQAAEFAVRVGEGWLQSQVNRPDDNSSPSTSQVWSLMEAGAVCTGNDMWWRQCANSWWATATNSIAATGLSSSLVATAPRYVIEEQEFVPDSLSTGQGKQAGRTFYRVTSKGTGGSDLTRMLLQTSFTRRY